MSEYEEVTLGELEFYPGVKIIGVHLDPERLQGVHLAPGQRFVIPLEVVIEGKARR